MHPLTGRASLHGKHSLHLFGLDPAAILDIARFALFQVWSFHRQPHGRHTRLCSGLPAKYMKSKKISIMIGAQERIIGGGDAISAAKKKLPLLRH
ncbi:hypothetical protein [Primorskyibacter marinus]|uniref:hypothetical protein n=1 Tax=Primorskyibacter marinus TaxID=1977320 RepID=UPI001300B635|nr:hypothetical protein [Primorskyibacter marinus]